MLVSLIPTELEDHKMLVAWAKLHPILKDLLIHIPNEGKRSSREANKLKRMGALRKGVSDFFLPLPNNYYHGMWLELKRRKYYKIDESQKEWLVKMRKLGYFAEIAYGFDDAKELLEDYLKNLSPKSASA